MSQLAIVATAEIAAGRIDEALPIFMAHRERCLRDEPGTLQFDVLRPREGDNKILLYEVYTDDAAFKAHWEGASVARVRQDTEGIVLNLTGVFCARQE